MADEQSITSHSARWTLCVLDFIYYIYIYTHSTNICAAMKWVFANQLGCVCANFWRHWRVMGCAVFVVQINSSWWIEGKRMSIY